MTDYYHTHFQDYYDGTIAIDPSSFLEPLAKKLAPAASILDVGCGSGRDLAWLKNRGYNPIGFERSPGLAALARSVSGCEVIEGDFETFDFSTLSVDAILLITALVHLPHDRCPSVVASISAALNPSGWMLISVKEGTGMRRDKTGRTFHLHTRTELERRLERPGFSIVETILTPSARGTGEGILSVFLRKG